MVKPRLRTLKLGESPRQYSPLLSRGVVDFSYIAGRFGAALQQIITYFFGKILKIPVTEK